MDADSVRGTKVRMDKVTNGGLWSIGCTVVRL
jgi:hypothetical protein